MQFAVPGGIMRRVRVLAPPHYLTTSPPHHLTTSPPHHLTTSPPHHLTTSPPHHLARGCAVEVCMPLHSLFVRCLFVDHSYRVGYVRLQGGAWIVRKWIVSLFILLFLAC